MTTFSLPHHHHLSVPTNTHSPPLLSLTSIPHHSFSLPRHHLSPPLPSFSPPPLSLSTIRLSSPSLTIICHHRLSLALATSLSRMRPSFSAIPPHHLSPVTATSLTTSLVPLFLHHHSLSFSPPSLTPLSLPAVRYFLLSKVAPSPFYWENFKTCLLIETVIFVSGRCAVHPRSQVNSN